MKHHNKLKALLLLIALIAGTYFCFTVPAVAGVVKGLAAGLFVYALTNNRLGNGELTPKFDVTFFWVLALGILPLLGTMMHSHPGDYWLSWGLMANPLWAALFLKRDLVRWYTPAPLPKKDPPMVTAPGESLPRRTTAASRSTATVKEEVAKYDPGVQWHPEWCASQLEWDLLRGHLAAEEYRMAGVKHCRDTGVHERANRMHWLLREVENLAEHPASRIRRVMAKYSPQGMELAVWQDVKDPLYTESQRVLWLHLEGGEDHADKLGATSGKQVEYAKGIVIHVANTRGYMDMLHWVSRGDPV